MADVLIDLGEVAHTERRRMPLPDQPLPWRRLLIGVAVLLVGLLTGAAHRGPPRPPVVVEARLGDMTFVSEDRLFVVSAGPQLNDSSVSNKIISGYALPSGELLSRTTVAVTGAIFNVLESGPVVLVSYQVDAVGAEATVALTEGTGRALWRRPARLLAASPHGLVLLRENSPQFGNLNWFGVDLTTGALRWSLRQPVRGITTEAGPAGGFPSMLITATDTGRVEVRDVLSGAVTATAQVPLRAQAAGSDVPIWPADGLLLVGAPTGTTAYALPSLVERWHSEVDLTGRWVQPGCAGAICSLSWQGGLRVLDPATGAQRWADRRWSYADQAGDHLLAMENTGPDRTNVVSVLDPATGRMLGDFGPWRSIGEAGPDGTVIGLREHLADDVVWYARLDPTTRGVRVLGMAEQVSGDCQTTHDVLVCRRIDANVGIWRLK